MSHKVDEWLSLVLFFAASVFVMFVGKEIPYSYNEKSPRSIDTDYPFIGFIVPLSSGVVLLILGTSNIFSIFKKKAGRKKLLTDGTVIFAEITNVYLNESFSYNGRNPFVLTCKWVDPRTNLFYYFRSPHIWFNINDALEKRGTTRLNVYIEREDPNNYWMVLGELDSNF